MSEDCIQLCCFVHNGHMGVGRLNIVSTKGHGETCIICDQMKSKGVHIYTSFLCVDCEREIIRTPTNHPKYKQYLRRLKRIKTPKIFF